VRSPLSLRPTDASSVLRDLHELYTTKEKKIILCDSTFETAQVLRWFLDLATTGQVTVEFYWASRQNLAKFLDKWDCQVLKETYLLHLRNSLLDGSSHFSAFMAAAELKCWDTCALALDGTPQACDADCADFGCIPGINRLNPISWTQAKFMSAPRDLVWALTRAFHEHETGAQQASQTQELTLGQRFLSWTAKRGNK
jgi:hypothetical protein